MRSGSCAAERNVTIIDRELEGSGANDFNISPIANDVRVFKHDIADKEKMLPLIENVDYIFNLSGYNNHLDSMVHPEKDLYANCTSQLSFLAACAEVGVSAGLVFTATRTQYGRVTENPVTEQMPQHPLDIHGAHKALAEQYHLFYHKNNSLKTVVARVTNVYGPRQPVRPRGIGLISSFILPVLEDGDIEIFGTGNRTREILYVDDLIDALLILNSKKETAGQCYNVGGFSVSLREIAETMIAAAGAGRISYKPFPHEVQRIEVGEVTLDSTKIAMSCGWRATTVPDQGFRKTMEFFTKNKDKYTPA